MKPMLKAAFYSLVNDLLARGIKPELKAYTFKHYGSLVWVEGDNTRLEHLYSVGDRSSDTAKIFQQRFTNWFNEIIAAYHVAAAEKLTVGEKVLDGDTVRTVTGFRTTVSRLFDGTQKSQVFVVLNNGAEVMPGDVIRLGPDHEPTAEENAPVDILNGMESKAEEEATHSTPDGMPMSKADFQALVGKVRAAGCTPRVEWGYVFKWSHLCWTAADGTEQRRALYQTSPGNAYLMRRRYENWLRDSLPVKE